MVSRRLLLSVFSFLLLATLGTFAGVASAAWPVDGRVLCDATGYQSKVLLASDGAGGAIALWLDDRIGHHLPYLQRVSHTGTPLWQANGVCPATSGVTQDDPRITSDGAGGAYLVWLYYATGSFTGFVAMAQRVNGSGASQWAFGGISVTPGVSAAQYDPTIVPDGTGGAFVAWADMRGGVDMDIYVQHLLPTGLDPAWPAQGRAVCTAAYAQDAPRLVADGVGGVLISWEDYRTNTNWDVYAHHVLANGQLDPGWPANGQALCNATGHQTEATMVTDGAGGAIVVWTDARSGTSDVYAQRISAAGAIAWAGNGVTVCGASGGQDQPAVVSDGATGALVAWRDNRSGTTDTYAQHVVSSGTFDPSWPSSGLALCTTSGIDQDPALCSDGAGGAIVAWTSDDAGTRDIVAQRALASGVVHPGWPANGRIVSAAADAQRDPEVLADGIGGALIAWEDSRFGATAPDIAAGRVSGSGWVGTPEPIIASVRDVPNDQGGQVSLLWSASDRDAVPNDPITSYEVWRQVPASYALAPARSHAGARSLRRTSGPGLATYWWEYVGAQQAHGFAGYSLTVPTLSDSLTGSNPKTLVMVTASDASTGYFYDSPPDSGYSVDNLAPATPGPFTGQYAAGVVRLHWNPSAEPDLFGYRVYRGFSAGFVPGPSNLVAEQSDTGLVDVAGRPCWYKLVAVDVHDNVSAVATLLPQGVADVAGDRPPAAAWLGAPSPNPAVREVSLRFGLARAGLVTAAVFDLAGRYVWRSPGTRFEAGEHPLVWSGLDANGRRALPGVYELRLTTEEGTFVRRVVLAR